MQSEGYDEYKSQLAADLAAVTGIPAEKVRRQLESGESIPVTGEEAAALEGRFAERRRARFDEAAEGGDYRQALRMLSSTEVAAAIVRLDGEYGPTDDEAREILRAEWDRCDAPAEAIAELLPVWRRRVRLRHR
jgi:hypothetical protein